MARSEQAQRQFRARVSGRVQGVGFRYFVHRHATRLGLRGWVRNLDNGDVEVVAAGPPQALAQLLRELHEGPPLSWIQNVAVEWQEPDPSLLRFEIRSTAW